MAAPSGDAVFAVREETMPPMMAHGVDIAVRPDGGPEGFGVIIEVSGRGQRQKGTVSAEVTSEPSPSSFDALNSHSSRGIVVASLMPLWVGPAG
ncbi:MAG: hypothetical protein U0903_07200 [Planctomycetales bacterium]